VADEQADELVVTDGMAARKTVMLDRSDVFLVLPGGLGTLDELFEVWTTAPWVCMPSQSSCSI
jgi:predicted Rossmann-fold nucleotide-binding protein